MKRKAKFDQILFECQYVAALKAVDAYFNNESKSIDWMYTRNPLLGDVIPKDMIKVGRFDKLMGFIYTQLAEDKV
jgi:uncharacterized protein (DUF2384 family)